MEKELELETLWKIADKLESLIVEIGNVQEKLEVVHATCRSRCYELMQPKKER